MSELYTPCCASYHLYSAGGVCRRRLLTTGDECIRQQMTWSFVVGVLKMIAAQSHKDRSSNASHGMSLTTATANDNLCPTAMHPFIIECRRCTYQFQEASATSRLHFTGQLYPVFNFQQTPVAQVSHKSSSQIRAHLFPTVGDYYARTTRIHMQKHDISELKKSNTKISTFPASIKMQK